jgi:hypothetical protein
MGARMGSAALQLHAPRSRRGQRGATPTGGRCSERDAPYSGLSHPIQENQAGWLGGRDSNPDTQIQSLQSYH